MPEPAPLKLPPPICPRCGYDLRGTAFAWEDACPLEGICPDCGHTFAWRDRFRLRKHPWLFEHQWRRRPLVTLPLTLVATLRPGWFWRQVRLEHRISLPVLAVTVAWSLILLLASTWALTVSAGAWDRLSARLAEPELMDYGVDIFRMVRYVSIRLLHDRLALVLAPLLVPLTVPLLFLTFPAAHIRYVHLLRITAYSFVGLAMLVTSAFYIAALLDQLSDLEMLSGAGSDGANVVVRYTAPWSRLLLVRVRGLSTTSAAVDLIWYWPLLAWWWRSACKHYLKLSNPGTVAVLLTLLACLAGLLAQLILVDGWLWYWQ